LPIVALQQVRPDLTGTHEYPEVRNMRQARVMLSLKHIVKRFDDDVVLNNFNLEIHDGEFFTLLGPSGCGKTTALRLIAGFEQADEGTIKIGGARVDNLPPEKRPVNTVFQSYALFPHMTVAQNVAFGLRMAGVKKGEIGARVREALGLVKLEGFDERSPSRLSGGQRQRVAIARAIVMRPKVLLLDESLSALDHRLRQQMRVELKQIQRMSGITFVYVTHDQEEALSMSDRLLVLDHGRIQQIGTPKEIYEKPKNLFVAEFIGEINVFDARIKSKTGEFDYQVVIGDVIKHVHGENGLEVDEEVRVLLRPEDLRVETAEDWPTGKDGFFGHVRERSYTGQKLDSLIELENGKRVRTSSFCNEDDSQAGFRIGQRVRVDWVEGWEHVIRKGEA
jgi:spermidine/putrescine transport system ATP-binding protein